MTLAHSNSTSMWYLAGYWSTVLTRDSGVVPMYVTTGDDDVKKSLMWDATYTTGVFSKGGMHTHPQFTNPSTALW